MKHLALLLLPVLAALPLQASADPWKDESGHGKGRKHDRAHKDSYWDGNCKVERKWERGGGYKEERKCRSPERAYREQPREYRERPYGAYRERSYGEYRERPGSYYEPAPVYVPAPPHVIVEPGVTIHGTIRLPH